ncbi:MAG: hypothetical protein AAGA28_03200 [Pseudomonadota bacterium]
MTGFDVLIVESDVALGRVWSRHLERAGNRVVLEHEQQGAMQAIGITRFDVVILNVLLRGGSAFVLADELRGQNRNIPVIFVNRTAFFSDGSLFALSPNARAHVHPDTPPDDLAAMVEYYTRSA